MQNATLRAATVCQFNTPGKTPAPEAWLLPVREHCTLHTHHYLAKCGKPDHLSHDISRRNSPNRNIRHDFRSEYENTALGQLYTEMAQKTISSYPSLSLVADHLTSMTRRRDYLEKPDWCFPSSNLLSSGMYVNCYLSLLKPLILDECPKCGYSHDTSLRSLHTSFPLK